MSQSPRRERMAKIPPEKMTEAQRKPPPRSSPARAEKCADRSTCSCEAPSS